MIIYEIRNKINSKCYVGQTCRTINERISCHVCQKSSIGKDIKKLGKENFEFLILENVEKENANEREKYWILKKNSLKPNGYNKALVHSKFGDNNGFYGKKHSLETIKKGQLNQPNRKRILCLENNTIYESTREAARETGSNRHMIARCCKGLVLKTNGLQFKYTV